MYNVVSTGSWNSSWETDQRQMTIKRASETKNKCGVWREKQGHSSPRQKLFPRRWPPGLQGS